MANKVFRLSISPEDFPEVRRVIDFDGRHSLADVHDEMCAEFALDDSERKFAFFLSGRFWDKTTAYWDPRTEGARADKALLFRLGLTPGKTFVHLLGFGQEQRFTLNVVEVRDVAQPLEAPALVESVGDAPGDDEPDSEIPESDPPEIAELVPLAEAFLDVDEDLDRYDAELREQLREPVAQEVTPVRVAMRTSLAAAQALVHGLAGSLERFLALDEWLLERSLGTRLLDLPLAGSFVGEFDAALQLARSLVFVDRELMEGDIAVILARAGRSAEALAQLESNLSHAQDAALVELKAGDTHHALGDLAAAEAYYRRSLEVSKAPTARHEARLRLADTLLSLGRDSEANQILREARPTVSETSSAPAPVPVPVVGRNDPCPCGSGKKYKKCHGANA